MITTEAVESTLGMARGITEALLSDLSDEDLLVRPTPGANHIAWQLGHLITAEYWLISQLNDQTEMACPVDWVEKYGKESASNDDPAYFEPKDRYLEAMAAQRQATLDALQSIDSEQLGDPVPEGMPPMIKTVGEMFLFQAHHELMHTGQFTCIRRKIGKPVLF